MTMTLDIAKQRLLNQQLIHPQFKSPHDVVDWMGMMQAQDLDMSLWAVGIRMASSTKASYSKEHPSVKAAAAALDKAEIVRTHLARCTWQLATKEDVRWMLELYRERNIRASLGFVRSNGRNITDEMMADSNTLFPKILHGNRSMTYAEIAPHFEAMGITDTYVIRHLIGVAESCGIICNGTFSGRDRTYALLEKRVSHSTLPTREASLALMAHKYFRSHAPATLTDYLWWSGLTMKEGKAGIEMLGDALSTETVGWQTYFIHKDNRTGRMPSNLMLLLPPFDEILIGYKDRSAVLPKEFAHKAHNNCGSFYPIVLEGKQIVGNWNRKDLKISYF